MTYPFDPTLRERVTDRLYDLLPELYRLRDFEVSNVERKKAAQTTPGLEELYRFLHVVAAPLAEVRQNIEELHANLFVDSAADWALPYLAELIDLQLIFPEARSNRRDLRSAVGFRRSKGTPRTLEQLANELSERIASTQEGYKLLLVSQDLDFLRPAHGLPSLVPAIIGESGQGPLDKLAHIVDIRPPTANSGRYHPRQIAHWLHATALFPLREGYPFARPPALDRRFAFDPLGAITKLRIRKETPSESRKTDRVLAEHFRTDPAQYFDQTGHASSRFCVRVLGLPAAIAKPASAERIPSGVPAHETLARTGVEVRLLEFGRSHRSDAITVSIEAVPLVGLTPTLGAHEERCRLTVLANGNQVAGPPGSVVPLAAPYVALLRLRRAAGVGDVHFSGATFLFTSGAPDASLASDDPGLAREGYLRGSLLVTIPPTWVRDSGNPDGGRWFYLGADGSLVEAQTANHGNAPDVALAAPDELPTEVLKVGPDPAWPPLLPGHEQTPLPAEAPAAWRPPTFVHGGKIMRRVGSAFVPLVPPVDMVLTLALFGQGTFTPFVRVLWTDDDPTAAASFQAIDRAGNLATTQSQAALAIQDVFTDLVGTTRLARDLSGFEVVARFEAASNAMVLSPSELVVTSVRGRSTLVHLPQLQTALATTPWNASLPFVSRIVRIQDDGSTSFFGTYDLARRSYGSIAPLREPAALLRRRVRQRTLCGWEQETNLPPFVPPTPSGYLDIDPEHGLFALANADALASYPKLSDQQSAPNTVTVDAQEGYSQHVGARAAFREPILNEELSAPTRIVLGAGRYDPLAKVAFFGLPHHETLAAALTAIQAMPPHVEEVIQIEDSATYEGNFAWPSNVERLTIQAAEGQRPVLRLAAPIASGAASYAEMRIVGVAISGADIALPVCEEVNLDFVSMRQASQQLSLPGPVDHVCRATIRHCLLGRLAAAGRDLISITDSVIDAAGGLAIEARESTVTLERVTVMAHEADLVPLGGSGPLLAVDVRVLSASEAILVQGVRALDRFHGCIRYSRVEPGSETPRRHRVSEDSPRFVSLDPRDAAHLRLSERCPRSILVGAEDGSEMGAFHQTRLVQMTEALRKRLVEFTPAGMRTGLIRVD